LLSIISPSKMKRFRFMSVLVSILIFIVSIYAIAFPNDIYMNTHKDLYLSQKAYVNAYLDLPETGLDSKFLNAKYKVNEKGEMTSSTKNQIDYYYFSDIDVLLFDEEEVKSVDLHIIFDVDDILTTELNNIRKDYKDIYQEDSENKISYASYIYYVSKIKMLEDDVTEQYKLDKFKEIHETEEAELKKQMEEISNYDLFNIEVSGDDYLLIFLKTSIVSQIPYYDQSQEKTIYPALSSYYKTGKLSFDFTNIKNLKEFGTYFSEMMFEPLSNTDQTEYLLQVVGYVLIFPAIFVLLLCWALKKRGVMKTYKEYYNVASIASIIPLLITFILAWFIPKVAPIYGLLFCVFVLFAFIKINSTPELAD